MLRKISEELKMDHELDLEAIARWSGYPDWKAKRAEASILRDIDPVLFKELVGINQNEIQMEIVKVMRQDANLSAKNKALELASKITGLNEPERGFQINIVNDGITIAD
jgi:hypothetical protein